MEVIILVFISCEAAITPGYAQEMSNKTSDTTSAPPGKPTRAGNNQDPPVLRPRLRVKVDEMKHQRAHWACGGTGSGHGSAWLR